MLDTTSKSCGCQCTAGMCLSVNFYITLTPTDFLQSDLSQTHWAPPATGGTLGPQPGCPRCHERGQQLTLGTWLLVFIGGNILCCVSQPYRVRGYI